MVIGGVERIDSRIGQRLLLASGLTALVFVLLLWRLYVLQVLRGDELTERGRENFVQRVEIPHNRGIIYDRKGRILADNTASLDLELIPNFISEDSDVLNRLALIFEWSDAKQEEVTALLEGKHGLDRFVPLVVARDLTPAQVEAVESERSVFLLGGVRIAEGRKRTYPFGSAAFHLLGYVNEIDPATLRRERAKGNSLHYERGDLIGRAGVERSYEKALRGRDGFSRHVVDAKGRRLKGDYVDTLLGEDQVLPAVPGHNLVLTLDLDLQIAAEAAFDGRAGALIAIDPTDGAILAWVSKPGIDANVVSQAMDAGDKAQLDTDPLKPWLNRVIQGQYAPGSTFKIVTALALLRAGISEKEKVFCPGRFTLGRHTWRCHKESGHGPVDLRTALKVSCDTYFYTMAHRIGINAIAEAGRGLGLGRRSGVEVRGEQPGLMPDEAFHDRVDKATGGYQKGMAINTAIGQGSVLMTPMQLAVAYAAVANGGKVLKPQMVRRVETADFRVLKRTWMGQYQPLLLEMGGAPPEVLNILQAKYRDLGMGGVPKTGTDAGITAREGPGPNLWAPIRRGLIAVAQEPGGTAYRRRSRLVSMAGKTGTAQVVRLRKGKRLKSVETLYEERDHAWFAAYAPIDNPRIVIAVVNEHSGHGGSQAEPIAVRVLDAWYEHVAHAQPGTQP